MTCRAFAGGVICGLRARRRFCVGCGIVADRSCDWPADKKRSCNAALCLACTTTARDTGRGTLDRETRDRLQAIRERFKMGDDPFDFCPKHATILRAAVAQRALQLM